MRRAAIFVLLIAVLIASASASCSAPDFYLEYRPPVLPIRFTIARSGISVAGDLSFVTPLGVFSLGAELPVYRFGSDDLVLILRDKQRNTDNVYRINQGRNARIVVDGVVTIEVSRDKVIVEVSAGRVVDVHYYCQLRKGDQVHARKHTRIWLVPNVVNCRYTATIPEGTSVYIVRGPEWGRIRQDMDYSGWWWQISETRNGAAIGWIWEGRIAECNYR